MYLIEFSQKRFLPTDDETREPKNNRHTVEWIQRQSADYSPIIALINQIELLIANCSRIVALQFIRPFSPSTREAKWWATIFVWNVRIRCSDIYFEATPLWHMHGPRVKRGARCGCISVHSSVAGALIHHFYMHKMSVPFRTRNALTER